MKQVPKRDLLFTYSLIQQDVLTTADFKATVQTPVSGNLSSTRLADSLSTVI